MTERKQDELQPKRTSARILFRKKLKSMSNTSLPRAPSDDDSDDSIMSPIEYGNPEDKLRFLKRLGLKPIIISTNQHQESKTDAVSEQHRTEPSKNLPFSSSASSEIDSDIEDLDLDLVYCPLDIPEIYEEITKNPFPNYLYEKSTCNNTNCCCTITQSDYESYFTPESSMPAEACPINTLAISSSESSSSSSAAAAGEKSSIDPPTSPISLSQPPITCDEKDDDCIIVDKTLSKGIEKPIVLQVVQNNGPIISKTRGNRKRRKYKRDEIFSKIIHHQDSDPMKPSCYEDRWDKIYCQRSFEDPNSTLEVIKRRLWVLDSKLESVED